MQGLTKLVIVISKVNLSHSDTTADFKDFCIRATKSVADIFFLEQLGRCEDVVGAVAPGHQCLQEHRLNTAALGNLQNGLKTGQGALIMDGVWHRQTKQQSVLLLEILDWAFYNIRTQPVPTPRLMGLSWAITCMH